MSENFPYSQNLRIIEDSELNGVWYGSFEMAGQQWRAGSLLPDWVKRLHEYAQEADMVAKLASEGIWLGSGEPADLAVMCCGLGSVWPGMGRELYTNFPEAAQAMDEVASLADWDLLGLMDETDPQKISQSRWQIPYLFMLEYAQWRLLYRLGLRPNVICGHSLGELIALCLANYYDLRSAWHLLETRAVHMAELEAKSGKQGGMLAVPADTAEIDLVLKQWPDLSISNRNTPKQFILSGPRESLMQARKALRRKKIPAVMLPMDLAFHNPAMRILRDLSVTRLNGLEMNRLWSIGVMLSCITGEPYPPNRAAICEAIGDLDENTVDWVKLIENIEKEYKVKTFLELGPQETLGGITGELAPEAIILAADKKGHEAVAMRECMARLYALGYLGLWRGGWQNSDLVRAIRRKERMAALEHAYKPAPVGKISEADLAGISETDKKIIFGLIAETCARPASEIRPEMELRADLALRSARFPFLLLEAEQRLGRQINLDNLFELVTVADLVCFLCGKRKAQTDGRQGIRREFIASRLPISRCLPDLASKPLDSKIAGIGEHKNIIACAHDEAVSNHLLAGLAAAEIGTGLPLRPVLDYTERHQWQDWNNDFWPFEVGFPATSRKKFRWGLKKAFANWRKLYEKIDGILLMPPARNLARPDPLFESAYLDRIKDCAAFLNRVEATNTWLIVLQRFSTPEAVEWQEQVVAWFKETEAALTAAKFPYRLIAWTGPDLPPDNFDVGDLVAQEIKHGREKKIIWNGLPQANPGQFFCRQSSCYDTVWPVGQKDPERLAFHGECQFSLFSQSELADHGADAIFSPLAQQDSFYQDTAWIPLGQLVYPLYQAAIINAPWLVACCLHSLHIHEFPALPPGITRECHITAQARLELPIDGVMARNCATAMEIAALLPNGRKSGLWQPLCDCAFVLVKADTKKQRLLQAGKLPASMPHLATVSPDLLYEALAFGKNWRFLNNIELAQWREWRKPGCICSLAVSGDKLLFNLLDTCLQAGFVALGLPGARNAQEVAKNLGSWRFSGIGYIRFDRKELKQAENLQLQLRPAWESDQLMRYHAGIFSERGHLLLALTSLEFDRLPSLEDTAELRENNE